MQPFKQCFMVKSVCGQILAQKNTCPQMQPNRNIALITFKSVFMLVLGSFFAKESLR